MWLGDAGGDHSDEENCILSKRGIVEGEREREREKWASE